VGSTRREILTDWIVVQDDYNGPIPQVVEPVAERRPFTPIEALMSTVPKEEPELSQLELLALRDILADALDELDDRDKRLVEAKVIECRSYRSLEQELGWQKSYMDRRFKVLLKRLAERLQDVPAIQEYLERNDPQT